MDEITNKIDKSGKTNMNKNNDHLWSELTLEQRKRLNPFLIEFQIKTINQCKNIAIRNHKRTLDELNAWKKNLERELRSTNQ